MFINTVIESVVSLTDAAKLLPKRRRGKRPNVATLYRWTTIGVRGVILESIQVGGTRCTSGQALQRFSERLTAKSAGQAARSSTPTSPQRNRDIARAEAVLDAAKI